MAPVGVGPVSRSCLSGSVYDLKNGRVLVVKMEISVYFGRFPYVNRGKRIDERLVPRE